MDPTVSHVEIFVCALSNQSTVIVKAHLLQYLN